MSFSSFVKYSGGNGPGKSKGPGTGKGGNNNMRPPRVGNPGKGVGQHPPQPVGHPKSQKPSSNPPSSAPKGRGKGAGNNGGRGFGSALYNPTQILKGRALNNAAGQIANAQTQGPITELAKQIASNNTTNQQGQQTDFGYYMQLAQAAKDAVGQQQANGAQLQGQLASNSASTQAGLAALGQLQQGGAVGRMNALGLGGDSAGQLSALTAQQQGVGLQNAQTANNFGAQQSANYTGNAINERGVVGLAGTEQIGNLARAGTLANEPLNAKIAAEQASKGALKATALGQLRTAERNYQIAEQGITNTQQGLKTTAAEDNARNKLTQQGLNNTRRADNQRTKISLAQLKDENIYHNALNNDAKLRIKSENDNAAAARQLSRTEHQATVNARTNPNAAPPRLTANENNEANTKIGEAIAAIQHWQAKGMANAKGVIVNRHPTDAQIRQVLSTEGFEGPLVETALDLLGWGIITKQTAKALNRMGVRGVTYKGKPARVGRVPGGSETGAANAVGNAAAGHQNLGL